MNFEIFLKIKDWLNYGILNKEVRFLAPNFDLFNAEKLFGFCFSLIFEVHRLNNFYIYIQGNLIGQKVFPQSPPEIWKKWFAEKHLLFPVQTKQNNFNLYCFHYLDKIKVVQINNACNYVVGDFNDFNVGIHIFLLQPPNQWIKTKFF